MKVFINITYTSLITVALTSPLLDNARLKQYPQDTCVSLTPSRPWEKVPVQESCCCSVVQGIHLNCNSNYTLLPSQWMLSHVDWNHYIYTPTVTPTRAEQKETIIANLLTNATTGSGTSGQRELHEAPLFFKTRKPELPFARLLTMQSTTWKLFWKFYEESALLYITKFGTHDDYYE